MSKIGCMCASLATGLCFLKKKVKGSNLHSPCSPSQFTTLFNNDDDNNNNNNNNRGGLGVI